MKQSLFFLTFFCAIAFSMRAQTGKIKGLVNDKTDKIGLVGAIVTLDGTDFGAYSDSVGNYEITDVPYGNYTLKVSYLSYKDYTTTLTFNAPELVVNIAMEPEAITSNTVVIEGQTIKSSASAIITFQRQTPTIVVGIALDDIKKTPDRTTSDVLKRVSGTTIQDNKFVVIRGLADRYNMSMLNGMPLPSTEPDRRAFSFDLFPATLLDNLLIYKTASPDLPGEFAGGVIRLNTKEIPEEKFTNISLGTTYNTQSTFKPFLTSTKGGLDLVGFDGANRSLPKSLPNTTDYYNQLENADFNVRYESSKLMPSDWALIKKDAMPLSTNFQFSSGGAVTFKNDHQLGVVGALSHSLSNRITFSEFNTNQVFDSTSSIMQQNRQNASTGAILNLAYKIKKGNKIYFNNTYSITGDNLVLTREGTNFSQDRYENASGIRYTTTSLFSTQLQGEHTNRKEGFKFKWGASYNEVYRNTPDWRTMLYTKNLSPQGDKNDSVFKAQININGYDPRAGCKFYSDQKEKLWAFHADANVDYNLFKQKNKIRFGFASQLKDKYFNSRVFNYLISSSQFFDWESLYKPQDSLINVDNIGKKGFRLRENTSEADSYTGNSQLYAGYAMVEQYFTKDLRLVAGLRIENFHQTLQSQRYKSTEKINVDRNYLDILPSLTLSYAITEKQNIRFAASRTVARPNFRELAPFAFYDFSLNSSIYGNDSLVRTNITNYDLRYEFFPGGNQMFAVTTFYKDFQKPIEQVIDVENAEYSFLNAPKARNYGIELEFRTKFTPLRYLVEWKQWENFNLFGNLAFIRSQVDQSNIPNVNDRYRPLQGQSPYIINGGLSYNEPNSGLGATVSFNRIGRRIWQVGQQNGKNAYIDIYEGPRSVLDIQVSKRIFKNGEIKINCGDVLNQYLVYYQDFDKSGKYEANGKDFKFISTRFGSNYSLTFGYKF